MACHKEEHLNRFRTYLRIPTAHPNIEYDEVVEFLKNEAAKIDLLFNVYYAKDSHKPIVCITWPGRQTFLPSIILNSYMDVNSVVHQKWTYPPFAAEIDDLDRIYARGAQSSKSNAMQYLSAIKELKDHGVKANRTIHVTFMPESGTRNGLMGFVKTKEYDNLNAGFLLDAGIPSQNDSYLILKGQRINWRISFHIKGTSGDPSLSHQNTTGQKLHYILKKMSEFRKEQDDRLKERQRINSEDTTTLNIDSMDATVLEGLLPFEIKIIFEVHLTAEFTHEQFESLVHQWCEEAGGDILVEISRVTDTRQMRDFDISDKTHFWFALHKALQALNFDSVSSTSSDDTDTRYVREAGTPALSFSPINNTKMRLHMPDEYQSTKTYLRGIHIFKTIIPALGNV